MTIKTTRNIRRLSQIVFFVVFVWLILKTTFEVDFHVSGPEGISLPYPVSIALQFDPLVALSTLLATGSLYKGLLWSLVVLIPTIFMGRLFCGWVCPLGTLNHWASEIKSERIGRKGAGKIASNRYHKYQRIKYYVLLVFLAASIAGVLQIGLLDPLPLLARSLGTAVLPMAQTGVEGFAGWLKSFGAPPLVAVGDAIQSVAEHSFLPYRRAFFHGVIPIALMFVLILILNRWFTRFWCRGICPLGALLGIFSRYAIFGLQKSQTACDQCNLCLLHCQGADNPNVGDRWRQSECHLCLNCQAACPQGALSFKFFPEHETSKGNPAPTQKVDITKRKAVASVVGGLALFATLRSGDAFAVNANPKLIRPPGSTDEDDFLARCIRCGQCMRVCPNNALHPTLLEAGAEGIWTPILITKIGYCEPTCTLCGQVCPTGAILELTTHQKIGDKETPPVRIGTAFVDHNRCLPWAYSTPCIVCEEWCPTSPKAIYLREETVYDRKGNARTVKRPYIDPEHCTGCGACEYACPVNDQRAIYISSVGESRSQHNQMLLERSKDERKKPVIP